MDLENFELKFEVPVHMSKEKMKKKKIWGHPRGSGRPLMMAKTPILMGLPDLSGVTSDFFSSFFL